MEWKISPARLRANENEQWFYQTLTLHWKAVSANATDSTSLTYRKTTAWFSERAPSLVKARSAMSSAPPIALPSFPPSGPLLDEEYVLRHINAWDDSCAVGNDTWNLLAKCAVIWVSAWRCAGKEGNDACEWLFEAIVAEIQCPNSICDVKIDWMSEGKVGVWGRFSWLQNLV